MDRTYVFNSDGNAGGGSRIDINSLLPGMMSRGIDPGMLALMNSNGFGGENGIWGVIYLAIIVASSGGMETAADSSEDEEVVRATALRNSSPACSTGTKRLSASSRNPSTAPPSRYRRRFATSRTAWA